MKYKFYWSGQNKSYALKNISDDVNSGKIEKGEKLADYGFVQSEFRTMLGKVLTVIDASVVDPKQNKAIKDIIRNQFIDEYSHLSELLVNYSQEEIDEMTSNMSDEEFENITEVSIEEVAGA